MRPRIGYTPISAADCERDQEEAKGRKFRWDGQPQRSPKKGEWYMSGAIPEAYMAPNDLSMQFFICIPEGK